MTLRTVIIALIGAVCGGGLGLVSAVNGTAAAARARSKPLPLAASVEPSHAELEPECPTYERPVAEREEERALQRRLGAIDEHLAGLRQVRVSREGEEQPWPDDVVVSDLRESVTQTLIEELAEFEGTLLDLDCDEVPCIAVVQIPKSGDHQVGPTMILQPFLEGLPRGRNVAHSGGHRVFVMQAGGAFAVYPLEGPGGDGSELRVKYRIDRVNEEVGEVLRTWDQ